MTGPRFEPTHAYVATTACGCTVAITVDNPDHRDDVRRFVSGAMRDGLDVTRVLMSETESYLATFGRCTHEGAA